MLTSGKSTSPQTFNRYVYVGNKPLVSTDPSGLCPIENGCEAFSGTVYTDGKGHYFSTNPNGAYTVFKGDVMFNDGEEGRLYRVTQFGWWKATLRDRIEKNPQIGLDNGCAGSLHCSAGLSLGVDADSNVRNSATERNSYQVMQWAQVIEVVNMI